VHVDRDVYRPEAALQPVEVLGPAKGPATIGRHHIVDTVTKNEATIQHRYAGVREAQVFAIQIHDAVVIYPLDHIVSVVIHCVHSNSKRTLSTRRPKKPASSTPLKTWRGSSRRILSPSEMEMDPAAACSESGAVRGWVQLATGVRSGPLPRGTVTHNGPVIPRPTVSCS